jgi:hypothetical protein
MAVNRLTAPHLTGHSDFSNFTNPGSRNSRVADPTQPPVPEVTQAPVPTRERPSDPNQPFVTTGSGAPARPSGGIAIQPDNTGNPEQPTPPVVNRFNGTRADFQGNNRRVDNRVGLGSTRDDFRRRQV